MHKFKSNFSYDNTIIFCDICGRRTNSIETFELEDETGKGGLLVCLRGSCLEAIDYGLIPYDLEAEKSPEVVRIDANQVDVEPSGALILDFGNINPMGSVATLLNWENINENWEDIGSITWDGESL